MEKIVFIRKIGRSEGSGYQAPGLGRALALARASGATLVILSPSDGGVHPGHPIPEAVPGVGFDHEPPERESLAYRLSRSTRALSRLARRMGTPTALVMKVMEGQAGRPAAMPRGLDARLLRSLPCPLWLLSEARPPERGVVLASVRLPGPGVCPADRRVLRTAAALARFEGSRLHLVHGWDLMGESILASPLRGLGPSRARHLLRAVGLAKRAWLRALLQAEGLDPHLPATIERGDPVRVVRKAVQATQAHLLVGAHRGPAGIWGWIEGNLLERFLDPGGLSVFAVRPEGPWVLPEAPTAWRQG